MAVAKEAVISCLCNVLKDAEKSGVPLKDIVNCLDNETVGRSARPARWFSFWGYATFTLFKLVACLTVALLLHVPVLQLFNGSPCLFPVPLLLTEMLQPPANCSMCQGVTEAPRLINLTRKEFALHHAYSSRPIVVVGAALQWPAMEVFSYDYFRNLYNSYPDAIDTDINMGQFFSYSSNIYNLKELFELSSERAAMTIDRWYIGWSTTDPHIRKEIISLTAAPYFLSPMIRKNGLTWIFMGAPGPGASMHVDSVGEPSWQAQISGTKTWTLAPPVECELICNSFNITVHKGDIIVIDTNRWYHQTFIHSGEISITIGAEYC